MAESGDNTQLTDLITLKTRENTDTDTCLKSHDTHTITDAEVKLINDAIQHQTDSDRI